MNKFFTITGVLLILVSVLQGVRYIADYAILTPYGKGFVWGCIILLLLGIVFMFVGRNIRKRKTPRK